MLQQYWKRPLYTVVKNGKYIGAYYDRKTAERAVLIWGGEIQ